MSQETLTILSQDSFANWLSFFLQGFFIKFEADQPDGNHSTTNSIARNKQHWIGAQSEVIEISKKTGNQKKHSETKKNNA